MKGTKQVLRLVFGGKIVQFDHVTKLIDVYRRVAIRKESFLLENYYSMCIVINYFYHYVIRLLLNVYCDKLFLSLCYPSIVQNLLEEVVPVPIHFSFLCC